MKRISLMICTISLLIASCNNETKTATETTTGSDSATMANPDSSVSDVYTPPDSATMMKNWQEYMTPSEPHKMMASWNGNWDGEVTMWHAPGAPPEVSKATAVNKMVMGGRYQVSNHKGNMMGMPFEGMSTTAYDNAKKTFITTWIDNVGTGLMVLEGPWDEASKTINLSGTCVDPSAGNGRTMKLRQTFKIVDDNNQVMEMYGAGPDGKEMKMMEIKYTRKK